MKLKINNKNTGKFTSKWKLTHCPTTNESNKTSKGRLGNTLSCMKMVHHVGNLRDEVKQCGEGEGGGDL